MQDVSFIIKRFSVQEKKNHFILANGNLYWWWNKINTSCKYFSEQKFLFFLHERS
jgi:hypothetical protein